MKPVLEASAGTEKQTASERADRKEMTGRHDPIRGLEVQRASSGLAKREAAGEDGLVAEVFQKLPSLLTLVTCLFDTILKTGRFPGSLLQGITVPLDKPNRDQE